MGEVLGPCKKCGRLLMRPSSTGICAECRKLLSGQQSDPDLPKPLKYE